MANQRMNYKQAMSLFHETPAPVPTPQQAEPLSDEFKRLARQYGYAISSAEYLSGKGQLLTPEAANKISRQESYNRKYGESYDFGSLDYNPNTHDQTFNAAYSGFVTKYKHQPSSKQEFDQWYLPNYKYKGQYSDTDQDKANQVAGLKPQKYLIADKTYIELQDFYKKLQDLGPNATYQDIENLFNQEATLSSLTKDARERADDAAHMAKEYVMPEDESGYSPTYNTGASQQSNLDMDIMRQLGYNETNGFGWILDKSIAAEDQQRYLDYYGDPRAYQHGMTPEEIQKAQFENIYGKDAYRSMQQFGDPRAWAHGADPDVIQTGLLSDEEKQFQKIRSQIGHNYDFNAMPALKPGEIYLPGDGLVINKDEILKDPQKTQLFLKYLEAYKDSQTPTAQKNMDKALADFSALLGAKSTDTTKNGKYAYFEYVIPPEGSMGIPFLQRYETADKALADRKNAEYELNQYRSVDPKNDKDAGVFTAFLGGLVNTGLFGLPDYLTRTDSGNSVIKQVQQQHPVAFSTGELAGMVMPIGGLEAGTGTALRGATKLISKAVPKIAEISPLLFTAVQGGMANASYGAVKDYFEGKSADEIAKDAVENAFFGAAGNLGFKMIDDVARLYLPKTLSDRWFKWFSDGRVANRLDQMDKPLKDALIAGAMKEVPNALKQMEDAAGNPIPIDDAARSSSARAAAREADASASITSIAGGIPESPGAARALPEDFAPAGARPYAPADQTAALADQAGNPFRYTAADRTALLDMANQHLSQAERLAEALGKKAEIVDGLTDRAGNTLGMVTDARSGKVLIPTGKEGYSASYDLIASGMTESLGKSGQYEAFRDAVLKSIPEDELAASVNKLKSIYGKQNPALIEREVVNEWVGNNLYNSSAIKQIVSTDPQLATGVREYLGGLKSKLGGMGGMQAVEKEVRQAEGMWERISRRIQLTRSIENSTKNFFGNDLANKFRYKLKEATSIDDVISYIRSEPIEKYDTSTINNMLRNIDSTKYAKVEKGTIKIELLKKSGIDKFDMRGTLADINSFRDMEIEVIELDRPLVLYRRGYPGEINSPKGVGKWWSDKYLTIEQARDELAICETWGNPLTEEYMITIPKGTKIIRGTAAEQTIKDAYGTIIEYRTGGGTQYFINDILNTWMK